MNSGREECLIFIICLVLCFLTGCQQDLKPDFEINAGNPCRFSGGDMKMINVRGDFEKDAAIRWEASAGTIENNPDNKYVAYYSAPDVPQEVYITVVINQSEMEYTDSVRCEILIPTTELVLESPTPTTEEKTPTPNAVPPTTQAPHPEPPDLTIAITEVFADACGPAWTDQYFEYIELFNYGEQPVDVAGMFIAVSDDDADPQEIVAWSDRAPFGPLSPKWKTDTTIIDQESFALIISPEYLIGIEEAAEQHYFLPYTYPEGIVILTIKEGYRLGNTTSGITGSAGGTENDALALFLGQTNEILDTYGEPKFIEPSPRPIVPLENDDYFPYTLNDCKSATRIEPTRPDVKFNWRVKDPSPGRGYGINLE